MIDLCRKLHNLTHPMLGRILMLHRVVEHRSDDPAQRELEVTPDFLEQTILDYRQKGYTFISIDELSSLLTTHYSLSTKKISASPSTTATRTTTTSPIPC